MFHSNLNLSPHPVVFAPVTCPCAAGRHWVLSSDTRQGITSSASPARRSAALAPAVARGKMRPQSGLLQWPLLMAPSGVTQSISSLNMLDALDDACLGPAPLTRLLPPDGWPVCKRPSPLNLPAVGGTAALSLGPPPPAEPKPWQRARRWPAHRACPAWPAAPAAGTAPPSRGPPPARSCAAAAPTPGGRPAANGPCTRSRGSTERQVVRQGPLAPTARVPHAPLSPPDNVSPQAQQLRIGQLLRRLRHQFPYVFARLQVPIQHPAAPGGQHRKHTARRGAAGACRQAHQWRARKAASLQLQGERGGHVANRWESGGKSRQVARAEP